ncbi:hypothetical protein D3C78_1109700 [compost metagenome]
MLERRIQAPVVVDTHGVRQAVLVLPAGSCDPRRDLFRRFPATGNQTLLQHLRINLKQQRHQMLTIASAGLLEMAARTIDQYVDTPCQPLVDLHANAITMPIGAPVQGKGSQLQALLELCVAQRQVVLAP